MSTCLVCTQREDHNPCPCTTMVDPRDDKVCERIMTTCKTCGKQIHYDKCKTVYHQHTEIERNKKYETGNCFYCRGESDVCTINGFGEAVVVPRGSWCVIV